MSRLCKINIFIKDKDEGLKVVNNIIEELDLEGKGTLRKSTNEVSYIFRNLMIKVAYPSDRSRGEKSTFAIYKKEDCIDDVMHIIVRPSLNICKNLFVDEYFQKTQDYDIIDINNHLIELEDSFDYMYDTIKRFEFNKEPIKKEKR